jgi:four helix bundle protein
MQDYSKLLVWQRSHRAAIDVYRLTKTFPVEERYGITSQLRRAAISVPTNIAEGSKRAAPRDYAHFLNIAQGSLAEAEYLILLSRDLGFLKHEGASPLLGEIREVSRMLSVLRTRVKEAIDSCKSQRMATR